VHVCFHWRPDDRDVAQCGNGRNQAACALAGTYTLSYRDDGDKRAGGCQLQWGIAMGCFRDDATYSMNPLDCHN
jgi:hypothetical protein